MLEKTTKSKTIAAKTHTSVQDTEPNIVKSAAKFPDANVNTVIAEKVQDEEFKNLIGQAGSVDSSNLNTNIEPSKYSEYFNQEAVMSAKNLFTACENPARSNPNSKKIIIMKQTPRYDPKSVENRVLNIFKLAGMVDQKFDHTNCPQSKFQDRKANM